MSNLNTANNLTLLRILLVPAFVLLVVYGYLGYALVALVVPVALLLLAMSAEVSVEP